MKPFTTLQWALAAWCAMPAAFAADRASEPMPPAYKQECAACHAAYPRSALPAASWQRIMSDLSHHFGTDASIDEAQVKSISARLEAPFRQERVELRRLPHPSRSRRFQ